ncbi:Copper-sensing transcriptional repressor CsoR [Phytobacter ursingii]|jgi:DNA-binding FrmR family transcriptional regulator|uniref:metal-sensing transcriptional repressor n=1 Tax=Enterobacteriaceae TaxID=543 RepID=UPI000CD0F206|nr:MULTISPECIES: metal-sensing transcriptional repressor [Citrobacter]AUU99591.1 metal resistance protein [Enterobacteriaceae bacterium ENNIH1]MDU6686833.1 metal-sensing transcriptional repressor [Enterobacteriaceae bacterium]VTP17219.1 Copper-sensing transcriptional repressor CsoR [Phytobacter ursingii]HAT2611163.1 metal-sensing transcriptional repressor [Kluyvera intermedia]EKY1515661.1 metal-sensing transcriptional repressor [Citrobacter freundii]
MSVHTSHPDIIKRLKRAAGHLKSTIQMLEDERTCLDIAQQLHAVEKAITNAKRTLIYDHLDHCLEDIIQTENQEADNTLSEFKEITKYL